ncbi:hypothetical protein [Streptosporangium longisporum]|uniref:Protein kinase domain-containing protein n=1 Tax=Streptosporangium longisporum TaxID=46187 RepID=A0ABP6K8J0_9ACTN
MTDPTLLAGRYRLLERRDHTGTTWRSRDELLRRDVTIAEVRLPPPGPYREGLLAQIRAAAGLRHPGVTALHDVIPGHDRLWLVMEAVEGRSLLQTVRADGPLSDERAAEVGLRVLDALTAAREQGVHLAATPDTVLLTRSGRVVLTGVVALATGDEFHDLGATLFTAVEGRTPGTGERPVPVIGDGTPLAAPATGPVGSTGSGPLVPLVEELLTSDSGHRPDATSVRLTLERIAPGAAPGPARSGPGRVGGIGAGSRRTLLAAVVALAVLLVGGGLVVWLRPRPAEPAPATTAPVTLPTTFTREPDPCTLLSADQAATLELETTARKSGDRECRWNTDTRQPSNLRYTLRIFAARLPSDERAREVYARFLTQEQARTRTAAGLPLTVTRPATPVAGTGSEAYTVEGTNTLTYYSSTVFRAANLVVSVQYERGSAEDAGNSTREGVSTATRWVLEKLARAR